MKILDNYVHKILEVTSSVLMNTVKYIVSE